MDTVNTRENNHKLSFIVMMITVLDIYPSTIRKVAPSVSQCQLIFNFFQVSWGKISMVEAERRLLANALLDPDNQHFVLLSDRYSCELDLFSDAKIWLVFEI
jgi:hypothetical protein